MTILLNCSALPLKRPGDNKKKKMEEKEWRNNHSPPGVVEGGKGEGECIALNNLNFFFYTHVQYIYYYYYLLFIYYLQPGFLYKFFFFFCIEGNLRMREQLAAKAQHDQREKSLNASHSTIFSLFFFFYGNLKGSWRCETRDTKLKKKCFLKNTHSYRLTLTSRFDFLF